MSLVALILFASINAQRKLHIDYIYTASYNGKR